MLSGNRTDVVLSYIALVLLRTIGIDIKKNNIVSISGFLIVLFKYPKIPFIWVAI